uniref:Homeodomain mating-type protein HD2-1 n=1 Tax=Auricularia heimuer TaxID=1579977 RepID=A0A7D3R3X9_9AGAM|nr:homeodomain mating-type protein HD2-1 [Auricularia heimuer]
MQEELSRTIAISRDLLSLLAQPSTPPFQPDFSAHALLFEIANAGIPKMVDSRVPDALATSLHSLTLEYFQKTCMGLLHSHAHASLATMKRLALQLKSTYTSLYERKVEYAASIQPKPTVNKKQPFANQSQTPTRRERERLATLTGMSTEQVRVWFQNRRSRNKKKAPELQHVPSLRLPDVLMRVAAANKDAVAKESARTVDEEFDDNDSGYFSGSDMNSSVMPMIFQRNTVALSTAIPTARSYPASYVPQPLTAQFDCDTPPWTRTPTSPTTQTSTVTIDELSRCMARLSLRNRRQASRTQCDSSGSVPTSSKATDVALSTAPHKAPRKPSNPTRKVAGGRRAAIRCVYSCAVERNLIGVIIGASQGSEEGWPPRRQPMGKTLSRQTSSSSVASSSSGSSRSTSYASDFSSASMESDYSFTSVESAQSCHHHAYSQMGLHQSQSNADSTCPLQETPFDLTCSTQLMPDQSPGVATHDPSSVICDVSGFVAALPDAAPTLSHIDLHSFDVGMADMGAFVDFSSASFPTLDALLTGTGNIFPAAEPLQQHTLSTICRSRCINRVVSTGMIWALYRRACYSCFAPAFLLFFDVVRIPASLCCLVFPSDAIISLHGY